MPELTSEKEVIYSLNIEDLQTVAEQLLERSLTEEEITRVRESVPDFIPWFDAISYAIQKHI